MGKEIVTPFVNSITGTFETIAKIKPGYSEITQIDLSDFTNERDYYSDIAAVIALPGSKIGSLVVAFESETAINMSSVFLNEPVTEVNAVVKDVVGEIANTVAGNITVDLEDMHFERALPNIYMGGDKEMTFPPGFVCYSVDFSSDFGPFNLRVSILEDENI